MRISSLPCILCKVSLCLALIAMQGRADIMDVYAAEPAKTLIVRPERLPARSSSGNSVIPARNPFAWPAEQLSKFAGDAALNTDPFSDFTLNAILWTEINPVAVINNTPLRLGESIDGVTIRKIDKTGVIIANRRTSRTLRFPDTGIEFVRPPEGN